MPVDISFLAALLVGFFGGVHCVGMCGGIIGALVFGLPEEKREHFSATLPYLLAYNGGRLLSYVLAGALAGGVGMYASTLLDIHHVQRYLQLLAGLFMLALGLYLAGWWSGLLAVEQAGRRLWRYLEPLGRRLMPVHSLSQAGLLGLLWGWLPCGLVYSVLIWALVAGGPAEGAMLMLGFGLGTLPTLLAMGALAAVLNQWVRDNRVRQFAGVMVIAFGLYYLYGVGSELFDLA